LQGREVICHAKTIVTWDLADTSFIFNCKVAMLGFEVITVLPTHKFHKDQMEQTQEDNVKK
jgi:DMSO reductase anchor subunit